MGERITKESIDSNRINRYERGENVLKRSVICLMAMALVLISVISVLNTSIAAGSLSVQMFNSNTAATTNSISPKIKLINQTSAAISLSTVTIRYYYTVDGDKAQNYWCDYAAITSPGHTAITSNVTGKFVKMSTTATGADYYLEIGFTSGAGSLAAGGSVEIQSRFAKTDWSNYTQTGDYSFNPSASNYANTTTVTAYVSGILDSGTEPGGTVVPTSVPTATGIKTPTPVVTTVITATPTPIRTATPTPAGTATPTPTRVAATPTPTSGPVATSGLPVPPGSNNVPRPSGAQGNLSVINWAGFKGAASYTFDDSNSSQISNFSTLMSLGIRMTFYLQTNKSESSNNCWAQALSNGCELGNHTHTHPQTGSGSDIDACTAYIQQHFGVTPLTMAAPYGDNSYVSLAQPRFLLNRGVAGGSIAPNGNTDPYNLNCNIPATGASASAIVSPFSSARNAGNWCILLVHGFTGGSDGAYQPVSISEFTSSVNTVKGWGDMWIDTVLNVGAYWRAQKLLSSVVPTQSGSDLIYRWTLPAHFPSGKYLRVKVTGGTLKQNGQVLNWDSHGYYEISLDAGSLTVSP
jgi:hypothetical protein